MHTDKDICDLRNVRKTDSEVLCLNPPAQLGVWLTYY